MSILKIIKEYKLEILLTIFLFSNLYTHFLPGFLYYISLFSCLFIAFKYKSHLNAKRGGLTIALILIILFSSLINSSITGRIVLISIIFLATQAFSSYKYYLFKTHFLETCLYGFAFTSIINFYAHSVGINYRLQAYENIDFTLDFSGFTWHPMWLSAACGIGTIYFTYLLVHFWKNKKLYPSLCMLPMILISIFTTIQGASRSALACSLLASMLLVFIMTPNIKKLFSIAFIILLLGIVSYSYLAKNSVRMIQKQTVQEQTGVTSRDALWHNRMTEFSSSPLYGIGFSASGVGDNKKVGRVETGSGWLTVLAQTGILGLILVLLLIKRAFIPLKILRKNNKIALYFALFIYMCLHTTFEAYLFQGGWYLCFIFWLTTGILDDSRIYYSSNKL